MTARVNETLPAHDEINAMLDEIVRRVGREPTQITHNTGWSHAMAWWGDIVVILLREDEHLKASVRDGHSDSTFGGRWNRYTRSLSRLDPDAVAKRVRVLVEKAVTTAAAYQKRNARESATRERLRAAIPEAWRARDDDPEDVSLRGLPGVDLSVRKDHVSVKVTATLTLSPERAAEAARKFAALIAEFETATDRKGSRSSS